VTTPEPLRESLRTLARDSIRHGAKAGAPLSVRLDDWPEALHEPRSTFVTLELDDRLRGCIGALEARRALVEDVAANAFAAAFRDPRFSPVTPGEVDELELHLSILSPPEPLDVESEAELLRSLRPGVDGLILEEGSRRGTFLPAVWRSLPSAVDFVTELKSKAGFPPDYWSGSIRTYRYTTEEF